MGIEHIHTLLDEMVTRRGSDLYLTHDCEPSLRVDSKIIHLHPEHLTDADLARFLTQALSPEQLEEFHSTMELNAAIKSNSQARFRLNAFRQQGHDGIVIRRIETQIPTLEELHLPPIYGELSLEKRGLILVSGQSGSGKSTTLSAMVGHRNRFGAGHIITIEDPIEFVHEHQQCIITQRDVGLDTYSYALALKNALRQRPDMVVIGEVRDREVMEQAMYFAETGHLCVATIHANNASQTVERVLNFFPEERHTQVLMNLALNLRATFSQRLVPSLSGGRVLAMEIMVNKGLIKHHIEQGNIRQLHELIEKGQSDGMQTFDQHLFTLFDQHLISEEVAIAEADTAANLRQMIQRKKGGTSRTITGGIELATRGTPIMPDAEF